MADVIGPDGLPLPGASGILNPNAGLGFFFGNNPDPATLEEIKRRRAVQAAVASQRRPFPKNVGEGIASLGEAFGDRMADNRLSAQEAAYNARTGAASGGAATRSGIAPGAAPVPGRTSEVADPTTTRNNIAALLTPGGGQGNPTEAGVTPPTTDTLEPPTSTAGGPSDNAAWSARANAIGGLESGGRYDSVSKAPTKYGHALGKYGVVEANVAPWTQAALGQPLTAQQFLANPQAQDAVFRHRFGQYVDKFGEEGAARAWFGGPGNVNNVNATDAYQRINVGQYGQDYLNRLRGAQRGAPTSALASSGGTMSDAPALGVPGEGAPGSAIEAGSDTDANPPTPTSIQPIRVAQASDLGRIPGAFDPRKPEPGAPPSGLPEPNPDTATFRPKPVPPSREGERMTPAEIEGYKLIQRFGDDPRMVQQGQMLMTFGKQQRDAAFAVKKDVFDKDMAAWESQDAAERAYRRIRPIEEQKLIDAKLAAQQAAQDRVEFPLGSPKEHQAVVKESYEQVKNIPRAQAAINRVRELMTTDGGMFTGTAADIKTSLAKMAQAVGAPYDPKASNTETFKGIIVPIMAALRPAVVGSGPQAVFEAKALQNAAAGNVSLERNTILNILGELEKTGVQDAVNHQRTVIANAGRGPRSEAMRQLWSNSYPMPMERLVPRGAVAALRQEIAGKSPEQIAAEKKDFDATYYTPGLADRLLGN